MGEVHEGLARDWIPNFEDQRKDAGLPVYLTGYSVWFNHYGQRGLIDYYYLDDDLGAREEWKRTRARAPPRLYRLMVVDFKVAQDATDILCKRLNAYRYAFYKSKEFLEQFRAIEPFPDIRCITSVQIMLIVSASNDVYLKYLNKNADILRSLSFPVWVQLFDAASKKASNLVYARGLEFNADILAFRDERFGGQRSLDHFGGKQAVLARTEIAGGR